LKSPSGRGTLHGERAAGNGYHQPGGSQRKDVNMIPDDQLCILHRNTIRYDVEIQNGKIFKVDVQNPWYTSFSQGKKCCHFPGKLPWESHP